MSARRVWLYPKGSWVGPLVYPGGDEYGNDTLVFRLPRQAALVVAWNVPLRRELLPTTGEIRYGWVGPEVGEPHNPLPLGPNDVKKAPPEGCYLVRQEVWRTDWTRTTPEDEL